MVRTHFWQEQVVENNGIATVGVTIETPDRQRNLLWYQVQAEYSSLLTKSCDPFVIATIFPAMSQGTDILVHGEVSPCLLQNLQEFQAVWSCWRPKHYQQVEITAEIEQEYSVANRPERAISAFSGGLDSCFTAFRHSQGKCGRSQRPLQAGLMIHGLDIPLSMPEFFDRAMQKSKLALTSLGLELIPMASNFRNIFNQNWEDAHGAVVASCLMLLQGSYSMGLIPSSSPYHAIDLSWGWGSNPLTDPLLSSRTFSIIHDGGAFSRPAKLMQIIDWPEALQTLRVCWEGEQKDRNCGHCEKCVQAILTFRVLELGLPPCFENDVTDQEIARVLKREHLIKYSIILAIAKHRSISDSWVTVLEEFAIANAVTKENPLCASHPYTCLRCTRMNSLANLLN
ncbi:MAG: hypothetical protein V7K40_33005 [Nostoc sp.]|uniref:hypothetical protein n=1 Tax=Nostoc sp. TaxID=1180 RepID=UPI002FFB2AC0